MKRSVRKRADRVTVRGVEVVYKKKDKAEVRIIQSSDEQTRNVGNVPFRPNIRSLWSEGDEL